ncbi:MAG: hypothetical protein WC881_08315 [Elusimicrobiota bacterium]|jgi:hypothetical protein
MTDLDRPLALRPERVPKSWGEEVWLDSTQAGGRARLRGGGTLDALLRSHPELLGSRSRALFGDVSPMFAKLITTDFPPLAHIGFNRSVPRRDLLGWLKLENAMLRRFHGALCVRDAAGFSRFQRSHGHWAGVLGRQGWRSGAAGPDLRLTEELGPLLKPGQSRFLPVLLAGLCANRARIVETLNQVDLAAEAGNLLLVRGGVIHALFGLSHQTHPRDPAQAALSRALRSGRAVPAAARRAGLPAPKNEAWLPLPARGHTRLAEVQQTSDTTYSLCDFFTPFAWKGRLVFRKGAPAGGVAPEELAAWVAELDMAPLRPKDFVCRPRPAAVGRQSAQAALWRLVDDPQRWPFFQAYRLELRGTRRSPASWRDGRAPGYARHLMVLEGEVSLQCRRGRKLALSARAPAFLPATLAGGYGLQSSGAASLLLFSVPA